jgi:hypothetical protein
MTGPDRPVRQTANTRTSCLLTCGGPQPDPSRGFKPALSGRRRRIDMPARPLEESRSVSCHRPGARGVHVVESTRIGRSRLEWPLRVARARRDGRGGSSASGRPRDVGPRRERWRMLERERDAAFEPPPFRTRICLSRVLTPPVGETRRRISNVGGVAMVVSRDARLRS